MANEETTATEATATQAGQTMAAKTLMIVVKRGKFGNSKRAKMNAVTVDADKALLRLHKQLLDSPELEAIATLDSQVDAIIRARSFTSKLRGVHMVAVGEVQELDVILTEKQVERVKLVDEAVSKYEQRTAEALERLRVVGETMDYPTVERFRATFHFEWQWVTFETPTRLKAISAALFENERAKMAEKLSAVADECQQAMRAGLSKLVEHLAERLTPSADGKKKKFTKSTTDNLNEFLATFELRNVTDDSDLAEIVKKARAVMEGVDKDTLKDELVRARVLQEIDGLQAALDPLVVEKGNREIILPDDDDPLGGTEDQAEALV
jgi:hypothetical protein